MASSGSSTPDLAVTFEAAPAEGAPRYLLRFGDQEFLLENAIVIGREESCDLVVGEPLVSRRHARISVDDTGAYIEDLGSANGTFVNHARLHGRAQLFPGDQVFIGTVEMELLDEAEQDRPTVPAPEPELPTRPHGLEPPEAPASSGRVARGTGISGGPAAATVPPLETPALPEEEEVAREIENAGRLADKMLAMGRLEAALKILDAPLAEALARARSGPVSQGSMVDLAGRYAVKLAAETLDGKWVDLAIELHDLAARPLREETMQQLATVRGRGPVGSNALIQRYVETLRTNASLMVGTDRILIERLACLLPTDSH